jgi:predicted secreted protein
MDLFTIIVVFVLTWWVVIFTVLPWGNRAADHVVSGHAPSAPANPRIKQKLLWTTIIAFIVTALIVATIHYTKFSFREAVQSWSME